MTKLQIAKNKQDLQKTEKTSKGNLINAEDAVWIKLIKEYWPWGLHISSLTL